MEEEEGKKKSHQDITVISFNWSSHSLKTPSSICWVSNIVHVDLIKFLDLMKILRTHSITQYLLAYEGIIYSWISFTLESSLSGTETSVRKLTVSRKHSHRCLLDKDHSHWPSFINESIWGWWLVTSWTCTLPFSAGIDYSQLDEWLRKQTDVWIYKYNWIELKMLTSEATTEHLQLIWGHGLLLFLDKYLLLLISLYNTKINIHNTNLCTHILLTPYLSWTVATNTKGWTLQIYILIYSLWNKNSS